MPASSGIIIPPRKTERMEHGAAPLNTLSLAFGVEPAASALRRVGKNVCDGTGRRPWAWPSEPGRGNSTTAGSIALRAMRGAVPGPRGLRALFREADRGADVFEIDDPWPRPRSAADQPVELGLLNEGLRRQDRRGPVLPSSPPARLTGPAEKIQHRRHADRLVLQPP